MSQTKPLVIVTRKLPDVIETRMMELFDTRLNVTDDPMNHEGLVNAVKHADVLVPTVTDRIDADVIANSKSADMEISVCDRRQVGLSHPAH